MIATSRLGSAWTAAIAARRPAAPPPTTMMSCSEISFIWSAALFVLFHSSSPAAVEARRGHLGRVKDLVELLFAQRQLLAGDVADGPTGGGSDLRDLGSFVVPHDRGQGCAQHQSAFHKFRPGPGGGQARDALSGEVHRCRGQDGEGL